ncbi:MAG: DNA adenine methylase, partial [Chloroflexota bacterium]|nr:DNA adenine methylase [Chloroflexota bacterium]
MAPWIIGHFPVHGCYVEPFCGAASVFLRKAPAEFEVINDLDGDVANFFRVLRERTDEFVVAIENTPYSREEYRLAWQPVDEPLERARRYYVRKWQGWGGGKGVGVQPSGWRYQHSNNRGKSVIADWNETEHLAAVVWRLKQAFIENDDAIKVIKRYD